MSSVVLGERSTIEVIFSLCKVWLIDVALELGWLSYLY